MPLHLAHQAKNNCQISLEVFEDIKPGSLERSLLNKNLLEIFIDGILILSSDERFLFSNNKAQQICKQLNNESSIFCDQIPNEIWQLYRKLLGYRMNGKEPNSPLILHSEIKLPQVWIRIRAQWHEDLGQPAYVLIILEDQIQTLRQLAVSEAKAYRLSARETEIWQLKRLGHTMVEIAQQLHISINTVKRHFQNINAKKIGR